MRVYFWGARGSLPVSLTAKQVRAKVAAALSVAAQHSFNCDTDIESFIEEKLPFYVRGSYGGNTACLEIRGGDEYILCDAGTGLRDFGNYIMKAGVGGSAVYNIFMSHLHWDHIQGFPFLSRHLFPATGSIFTAFIRNWRLPLITSSSRPRSRYPSTICRRKGNLLCSNRSGNIKSAD